MSAAHFPAPRPLSAVARMLSVCVISQSSKEKSPSSKVWPGRALFLSDTETVSMPLSCEKLLNHLDQVIPADKENGNSEQNRNEHYRWHRSLLVLRRQRSAG